MTRTMLAITDDLRALDALLSECGGDVSNPDALAAVDRWFAELDSDFGSKADNYAALITEMRMRAEGRRNESERLAARAATDERSADFLAARLMAALDVRGVKRYETDRYAISVVGNGGKQPMELVDVVPPEFTRSRTIVEPDKDAIRSALESGQALPFARLNERGKRLSIR
jgi:hypothetical protein